MVLLERAFQSVLQRYLPPLLETVFHSLEKIYPYYLQQSLSSDSASLQLSRYIISLFGILQIILRCPSLNLDSAATETQESQLSISQHIFSHTLKFSQLSDETVKQWLDDPISAIESDITGPLAVRTLVLDCAMEHFRVSFAQLWLQQYPSIHGEYAPSRLYKWC